jgi:hypothetical protein
MTLYFSVNQTATAHEVMHDGHRYLVAPVVALVAGVVNSLYVPADELSKHIAAWNGRPISLGHPQANGQYISANSPDVWASAVPGQLWNAHADGDKLKADLWLDLDKAAKLGDSGTKIVQRLRSNQPVEVSTGYFADVESTPGVWNGKSYTGITRNIRPDHLALLPDELGACSWMDGCGAPRVNSEKNDMNSEQERGLFQRFKDWLNGEEMSDDAAASVGLETNDANGVRTEEQAQSAGEMAMTKAELVTQLVANAACKFDRDKLEAWEEADLQTLSESLAAQPTTPQDTENTAPPAQASLPPEITAFAAMIQNLGGVDKLGAALGAITANADQERTQLVAELVANAAFTAEELAVMPIATLRKLNETLLPRDFSLAGGVLRANFGAEEEELAMPYTNGTGGTNG